MKRLNNKGFILVETLIVAVFIMTIFVFVYRNSIPMMGQYEKMETFDDIDSVYAANMVKQMTIHYLNFSQIDIKLANQTFVDISNCTDTNLYSDSNYCLKLKRNLHIQGSDIIYITRYDPSDVINSTAEEIMLGTAKSFRNEVKKNSFFDSGELSKFRDYLKTVPNQENFYDSHNSSNKAIGLYRLYISRTVPMMDGTNVKKFANIGIYKNIGG